MLRTSEASEAALVAAQLDDNFHIFHLMNIWGGVGWPVKFCSCEFHQNFVKFFIFNFTNYYGKSCELLYREPFIFNEKQNSAQFFQILHSEIYILTKFVIYWSEIFTDCFSQQCRYVCELKSVQISDWYIPHKLRQSLLSSICKLLIWNFLRCR